MMSENHNQPTYKKVLLNRVTATTAIVEYIENCLATEDKAAKDYFHKIMIHNWQDTLPELFDRLSTYFGIVIIPVNCTTQGELTSFYTSNLNVILKIIRFDFLFPHCRNMFSIDVLYNDKCSADLFGKTTTIDDIVSGIVSRRFDEHCELDLSNFCDDPEFANTKICMYKINLLAQFKILMLRMGRDTKTLNLSNNNLSQVPLDVLNFFIKADLTAVNFSNNNIPSFTELLRVSSKIEKLWLEGNPLCEGIDAVTYVKTVFMKFPRLNELDGIQLNQHGLIFPFYRNFLITSDRRTKMVVEKFVTLYFSKYDQEPRRKRKIELLYDEKAVLVMSSDITDSEPTKIKYSKYVRNIIDPTKKKFTNYCQRVYRGRQAIANLMSILPDTIHDRSTFTVDVPMHDKQSMFLIIDGIFKEKESGFLFQFRRSFVFGIYVINGNSVYHIKKEIFSFTQGTEEQMMYSFKNPVRNMNSLTLINPEPEEKEAIIKAFQHYTSFRKSEAEARLMFHNWDFRDAMRKFISDSSKKLISPELFLEDDLSDVSSLLDDEIDY